MPAIYNKALAAERLQWGLRLFKSENFSRAALSKRARLSISTGQGPVN